MYLESRLLTEICPDSFGIKNPDFQFHTIASNGAEQQPFGLFIPLWNNSEELLAALNNGAIAAVWEANNPIPPFVPNHFPMFLTKNIWDDVKKIMNLYIKKLEQEEEIKQMSTILFLEKKLLNEKLNTYDNSKMLVSFLTITKNFEDLRRG